MGDHIEQQDVTEVGHRVEAILRHATPATAKKFYLAVGHLLTICGETTTSGGDDLEPHVTLTWDWMFSMRNCSPRMLALIDLTLALVRAAATVKLGRKFGVWWAATKATRAELDRIVKNSVANPDMWSGRASAKPRPATGTLPKRIHAVIRSRKAATGHVEWWDSVVGLAVDDDFAVGFVRGVVAETAPKKRQPKLVANAGILVGDPFAMEPLPRRSR